MITKTSDNRGIRISRGNNIESNITKDITKTEEEKEEIGKIKGITKDGKEIQKKTLLKITKTSRNKWLNCQLNNLRNKISRLNTPNTCFARLLKV